MTTNTNPHINEVRTALLDTLKDLRCRENPMDLDRARTVAQVASVLVDTAKAENEYLKITHQDHSAFMEAPTTAPGLPSPTGEPSAHNPFPTSAVHRLRG